MQDVKETTQTKRLSGKIQDTKFEILDAKCIHTVKATWKVFEISYLCYLLPY